MARTYYYVIRVGGHWAMRIEGSERTWEFATEAEAVTAARNAARTLWENKGMRSAMRIQQPDGSWREDTTHGETPFPATRKAK